MKEGQFNINLGTSGWVATISEKPAFNEGGIFNLAAMPEGKIINVVPFLNAGNVHRWLGILLSDCKQSPDYDRIEKLLENIHNMAEKMQKTLDVCRSVTELRTPFRITQKHVELNFLDPE